MLKKILYYEVPTKIGVAIILIFSLIAYGGILFWIYTTLMTLEEHETEKSVKEEKIENTRE
ncbi:MAG: hypothetical protein PHH17_00390 [Candidatus Pacebacteria bacterium]|jgi:hypothetical protein|nr:hypothetical protein [Candidatus Paceibacterota bacterium]MDD3072158.1 hypothetical protein [Candidatus Paceibacterota bacterium]MDD3728777.1 hypothetical protein [Candidatus Paceibacterota bacterium]MDD4201364.1 hypothetical protein [Candidatus Paceibacterota bacterium]MDD4466921.1 hypothetical protein [Candidatus Paceibacterota bacterium]